ncbi:YSIRK-type signal peptide-containing protein [Staphylococcus massiliensis]|uniref:YSIRK-type signal peptide-containing protein n=1 Tax=Staphylococcus massiliensis TaxID=555791 RepID=UPI001EDE0904|nr:YSIRK-type signal peptide-containing protein [Staphylococcus massiliensis]MCG3398873.1 YSIRK-type signal peptide-containing protein [Staphylococcus massiliensis]
MRHQKIQRFGIRKYNVGLFSTVIGTLLFLGSQSTAFADETTHRESNVIATTIHESESDKEEADTPKPEEAITPLESETSDDTNTLNVKDEVLDYESKTETESEASEDDAKDKVEEKDKKDEETQEEKSEKEAKSDKEDEASKSEESQKEDTPKTEKAKAESREATEDSKPRRRGKRSLEANSLREATPPENNPIRKRSKRATNDPTPTQDRSNRHSFIYGDPNDPRTKRS